MSNVYLTAGNGNKTLTLDTVVDFDSFSINFGHGDHEITIGTVVGANYDPGFNLSVGTGDHQFNVVGQVNNPAGRFKITAEGGTHTFNFNNSANFIDIETGDGDATLSFFNVVGDSEFALGAGADNIYFSQLTGTTVVDLGQDFESDFVSSTSAVERLEIVNFNPDYDQKVNVEFPSTWFSNDDGNNTTFINGDNTIVFIGISGASLDPLDYFQ